MRGTLLAMGMFKVGGASGLGGWRGEDQGGREEGREGGGREGGRKCGKVYACLIGRWGEAC